MGRPRTAIGTHGKVALSGHVVDARGGTVKAAPGVRPTTWRARTKFRDGDGVARDVERWGQTKTKAEAALKAALVERKAPVQTGGIRAGMTVEKAGETWLASIGQSGRLSANTRTQYRTTFNRHVRDSRIASLTLTEANRVAVLEGYLQRVAGEHGKASAKTVRSVVSSILTMAVRHEAIDGNRMRDIEAPTVGKVRESARDDDRAFTEDELRRVLALVRGHDVAVRFDLVDLVHFLAGTGARHTEALTMLWDDVTLRDDDGRALKVGEAHIRGTKTKGSDRRVPMPDWLTKRLRERAKLIGTDGLVFPTPGRWGTGDSENVRDRRNVSRHLRAILDDAGMTWATAKTFRLTVGDLVAKNYGLIEASKVLGHSRPSMTADRYTDKRQSPKGAALALAGLGA